MFILNSVFVKFYSTHLNLLIYKYFRNSIIIRLHLTEMKRLKSLLPRLCRKKLQQAVGAKLAVGAKQIPITKAMLQTARRVYQRVHTG